MDIAMQIQDREARAPSKLTSFLASTRMLSRVCGLFLLHLKPIIPRKVSELWRMNTAGNYVRGEEFLGGWKPRGVSLVTGFKTRTSRLERHEEVSKTRQFLQLRGLLHPEEASSGSSGDEAETVVDNSGEDKALDQHSQDLLQRMLQLWTRKEPTADEVTWPLFI